MALQRGMPVNKCLPCQGNRHVNCDHHENDGAVDAMDFVNVRCECPCEGQVYDGTGLIGLVADLRRQIKSMETEREQREREVDEIRRKQSWLRGTFAEAMDRLLSPDDEGNLGIQSASPKDLAAQAAIWSKIREEWS